MICKVLFLNQNTRNSEIFFASRKRKSHLSVRDMTHSVLLRLKSGQLVLELCCSYDYDNNKQLLDEVFVISRIIKVEVSVIS